jgi:Tol biopolymer transport system component
MNARQLTLILAAAMTLFAQADVTLQRAIRKETLEGDLKGAIALYEKTLSEAKNDRAVAAKALIRMAECHQKLGDSESQKIYERVVREFGDQKEASTARARLTALRGGATSGAVQARLVWDNAMDDWGSASADGRYLSFVNWPTRGIGIRDLATGNNHAIPDSTLFGDGKGEAGGNAISPDANRVAFAYLKHNRPSGQRGYNELHVLNADGAGHKVLLAGHGIDYVEPYSWSPDGKWIAAAVWDLKEDRLALIPSSGGEPRYAPIPPKQAIESIYFSPDGKWLVYSASTVRGGSLPLYLCSADPSSNTEVKLTDNAYPMGWSPNSSAVLFSRERSGKRDLYVQPVAAGKPSGEPKIVYTNSDIGTNSLGVSSHGTLLYSIGNRHADATIYPFSGDLAKLANPSLTFPVTSSVSWLLGGGTMRFSPDGKRLLAVGSSRELIIRSLVSDSHQTITPRLKRFTRTEWAPDGASILLMGMNDEGQHGILRLDLSSGATTFLTPLPERTWNFVPSPDGRTIYHGGPEKVFARDLATGQDKQVWSGDGLGNFQLLLSRDAKTLVVRTSGYLGVVDLTTGQSRQLYGTTVEKDGIVWASAFNADETKVLTIHRAGSMANMEFGIFPIDGSTPTRFRAPKEFRGLTLSPDGKFLATTFLTRRDQVWALENFLPSN